MTKNGSLIGTALSNAALIIASGATALGSTDPGQTTESEWTFNTVFNQVNSAFQKSSNDYGVTPSLTYESTVQGNPTGGVSRTVAYAHFIEFGLGLDLEKIANIDGASFNISGVHAAGRNLSDPNYINNAFPVSQAFIGRGMYLYQLYWQQDFKAVDTVVRIGRIDSSNFASLPAFGLQVNGGVDGNPDSLFVNSNFQSIPIAVWGADVSISPSDEWNIYTGIYQATNFAGNHHGTDFSWRSSDRILWMAQVSWTPTFGKDGDKSPGYSGTYIAGLYYSNLPQQRFIGVGTVTDTVGFYLMGQQTVWYNSQNTSETFDVWGGFTYSPQGEVAQMEWMGFGGFVWTGPIPGRTEDQLLGTVLVGTFSSDYATSVATPATGRPTYEMVLELSYIYNVNSYFFIQPDIQYVIRPNGVKSTQDALVIGAQFGISF